jgi:hypothetical protein
MEDRPPRRLHPYGAAKQFALATPSKVKSAFERLSQLAWPSGLSGKTGRNTVLYRPNGRLGAILRTYLSHHVLEVHLNGRLGDA